MPKTKLPAMNAYPFDIRPLSKEDGGGYLLTFSDLPGCMADGETQEEVLSNGKDAFRAWMETHLEQGRAIPKPEESAGGAIVTRIPKSVHMRLLARAKQEGVSMNLLVATFIAEGLGRKNAQR